MSTLTSRLRVVGAVTLILLGAIVVLFYRGEEFGALIGTASIGIGLGFLWRLRGRQQPQPPP